MHGHIGLLFIYLSSGILANIMTYYAKTSPYALGASGAIFGLIGYLAMHYYRNRRILGVQSELGTNIRYRTSI